jgi:hypothetical protein
MAQVKEKGEAKETQFNTATSVFVPRGCFCLVIHASLRCNAAA